MDYQKTGRVIAARRQELGLTQKQLAERLNISDRTVSRWERGVGFPDVSLLEPLADALELSLGELIRGERLPPASQPSPETEQEVRAAAIGLGGHLRQALRRTRRLMTAQAAVLICVLVIFPLLWLNPPEGYPFPPQSVSAAQAAKLCPFSLITRQEFELAAALLANEDVAALFSSPDAVDPPLHELDPGLVDADALQIDGRDAQVTDVGIEVGVYGLVIYVDYSSNVSDGGAPSQRCILSVYQDGTVRKASAEYNKSGAATYIIDNMDNTSFTRHREYRDLHYFFHGY